MRILVVDDEKLLVKGMKFNLQNEGYEVECAYDGAAAVELARNGKFDLIVLDVMMPEVDGLEACMRIREFSNVPIIMLTAKSEDADKLMGFECGADDYITKPFNILELKARVRALLRRAGLQRDKGALLTVGDLTLNTEERVAVRDGKTVELTAKECLRNGNRKLDQLVDHLITGKHQHQDDISGACQDQIISLNRGTFLPMGCADGRKIRCLGNQLCNLFDQLIYPLHLFIDGAVDGFCLIHTQPVFQHQLIYIEPIAGSGGNPSGAGMGLLQITHAGQVCHLVADGSGGILHIGKSGDGLGAHRLCRPDIQVNDGSQDLLFPLGQFHCEFLLFLC